MELLLEKIKDRYEKSQPKETANIKIKDLGLFTKYSFTLTDAQSKSLSLFSINIYYDGNIVLQVKDDDYDISDMSMLENKINSILNQRLQIINTYKF